MLRARGAAVVHLVRESVADCVASRQIAEHRGYHRRDPLTESDRALRLTIDFAAAGQEMRAILAARDFVRRAFRGHGAYLELSYPAFIAGESLAPEAVTRIATQLGLPEAAGLVGPSRLQPSAPDKAAAILNWAEVRDLEARIRAERGDPPLAAGQATAA